MCFLYATVRLFQHICVVKPSYKKWDKWDEGNCSFGNATCQKTAGIFISHRKEELTKGVQFAALQNAGVSWII